MEIHVREDRNCVDIWLTQAEGADEALRAQLSPLYQQYHARRYQVAVFISGCEPLYEETRELLLHCRRRQAEREAQGATLGA